MDLPKPKNKQKMVVIIGAGFAGLTLARRLSSKYFQVLLLDKNNYHQFQPLLYQVATCGLEPSSISFPLRKAFQRNPNVFIRITEVQGIDAGTNTINTSIGDIAYDYLVLAHGAETNYFMKMQLQQNALSMKSVSEALLLRNTLLQNYEQALTSKSAEEKAALLNVVIVGGGPTGVELAGAIAEMKMTILPKEYTELNFQTMEIYLLEAAPGLLNGMSEYAGITVREYLQNLGVKVQLNATVQDYDGQSVLLSNGESIHSRCLIWAAGVKGADMQGLPASSVASNNRILVDEFNRVNNLQRVFAIGDVALMRDEQLVKGHPQVAPVAIQQAKLLAKNLKSLETQKQMLPFQYRDKGSMATVGRNLAVAEMGAIKVRGFVAWLIWMMVHLMSIIGIKNRIFILINWVWQYITYDQSLRLIIKPSKKNHEKIILHATSGHGAIRKPAVGM